LLSPCVIGKSKNTEYGNRPKRGTLEATVNLFTTKLILLAGLINGKRAAYGITPVRALAQLDCGMECRVVILAAGKIHHVHQGAAGLP
jgi:hypothetical protein